MTLSIAAVTSLAAVLALPTGATSGPSAWQPVETTRFGSAAASYHLTTEANAGDDNSPRLSVLDSSGHATVITFDNGMVPVSEGLRDTGLPATNQLKSKYVFEAKALTDRSGERLVVVFGAAMDPDPFAIRVLRLGPGGKVETLLSEDAFVITSIADLDHDGVAELIGRRSYSQMDTKCLSTYDPISVFRLAAGAQGRFVYAENLSKAYNLAHHYVWDGPNAREDVAVDVCLKAGPRNSSPRRKTSLDQ